MEFSITILGINSAKPAYNRNQTSQLIHHHLEDYLIDCGEGTQLQLVKFQKKMGKINHIFISHLHGDHYFGLIGLLSTMNMSHRETPLHVYAPAELEEIILLQNKISGTRYYYPFLFHAIDTTKNQVIYENDYLTVETIPMDHFIACSGFLFKEKPKKKNLFAEKLLPTFTIADKIALRNGDDIQKDDMLYKNSDFTYSKRSRSYAYCSDTKYNERIIDQITGVDILYHEATYMNQKANEATTRYHSTAEQAALIAKKANAKKLILGHYSSRYKELDGLLAEAKLVFEQSYLGIEGETIELVDE